MHSCPICINQFSNFLPIPEQYVRQLNSLQVPYSLDEFETLNIAQYLCPVCGATDRDRLYALFYKLIFSERFSGPKRILDIAPSKPLSWFLRNQPDVTYLSGDLNSELADEQVDICDMRQFDNSSFDFIVCSHVLEHVEDDRQAMRELLRVLSPLGRAILMVPILLTANDIDEDPFEFRISERWRRFGQDDHVRMYNRDTFLGRLGDEKWKITEFKVADFNEDTLRVNGVSNHSVLYVGGH